MTERRRSLIEEMKLQGFSERTQASYPARVRQLAKHYMRRPVGPSRSCLKAYESVAGAIRGIGADFDHYNQERPHQALSRLTPNEVYAGGLTLPEAA